MKFNTKQRSGQDAVAALDADGDLHLLGRLGGSFCVIQEHNITVEFPWDAPYEGDFVEYLYPGDTLTITF